MLILTFQPSVQAGMCNYLLDPIWIAYQTSLDKFLNSSEVQNGLKTVILDARINSTQSDLITLEGLEALGIMNSNFKLLPFSIHSIMFNYNIWLDRKVKEHNRENPSDPIDLKLDTIRPGVLFFKGEKVGKEDRRTWLTLELGDPIPDGFMPYDLSDYTEYPPAAALYGALAKGFFPFSIVNLTSLKHELLSHLVNYPRNLGYARAYRKITQKLITRVQNNIASGATSPWSFFFKTGLFSRVYVFNESLLGVKNSELLKYSEELGVSVEDLNSSRLIPYNELLPSNQSINDVEDLLSLSNKLSSVADQVMVYMGGATRLVDSDGLSHNIIFYIQKKLKLLENDHRNRKWSEEKTAVLLKGIGLIRGFLVNMRLLNPTSLAEDIFSHKPDMNSPMTYFYSPCSGYLVALIDFDSYFLGETNPLRFPINYTTSRYGYPFWHEPIKSPKR